MPIPYFAPLRRRIPLLLITLAAALGACGGGGGDSSPTNPSPTTGPLSGVVRRSGNNTPLAGASVKVGALTTASGADGTYSFPEVPLGLRTIQVSAGGYTTYTAQVTVVAEGTTKDVLLQPTVVFTADIGAVYVPANVTTVRAVMIYLGSFDTRPVATGVFDTSETGLAMQTFRSEVSALLDQHGVALVGIQAVHLLDDASMKNAIDAALSALGAASGHSEIGTAPILPIGMSAGARPVTALLQLEPQRLVAFFNWIGVFSVFLTTPEMRAVPGALLMAERDSIADNAAVRAWFDGGRSQGALWSIGTKPAAIHNPPDATVRSAMFQWLGDELAARLPPGATTLVAQTEDAGWLGDLKTLTVAAHDQYSGDPLAASWFPSQGYAARWQLLVTPSN